MTSHPATAPDISPRPVEEGAPPETRDRLLEAAESLFARHGYAATSVREITADAGSNLAAVNYHFGGKRNLYREVLTHRIDALREQRLAALQYHDDRAETQPSLKTVLLDFADAFVAPMREDPEGRITLRLLLREVVDPLLPADLLRRELVLPVARALRTAVATAAPELDDRMIRLCVQSFLAQLIHVMHAHRFSAAEPSHPDRELSVPELVQHTVRFTIAGIEKLREQQMQPSNPAGRGTTNAERRTP